MHWADILIGGSCLAGLVLGVTGRGLVHLSLMLAAVAAAAAVGYIWADEVAAAGLIENPRGAFAAVSAAVFASLAVLWKLLKSLPLAGAVLKITDALMTAFVLCAGAFLAVSAANGRTGFVDAENTVIYNRAAALWEAGAEKITPLQRS